MDDPTSKTIAQSLDTVARNLERHMEGRGLTEDALAEASGISRRTVGNFLRPSNRLTKRGTSESIPSGTLANLVRIAAALEVEAWELLCDATRVRFLNAVELAYQERHRADSSDA